LPPWIFNHRASPMGEPAENSYTVCG
jgi:hypothetical protein